MEERIPIRLPVARAPEIEWAWSDVCAAIEVVAAEVADRITITNVEVTDELAGRAAALAQRAGVAFALERHADTAQRTVRVGPRL